MAHEIDKVLADLLAWKNAHPTIPAGTQRHVPMLSKEHLDMEYYNVRAVRTSSITMLRADCGCREFKYCFDH